MLLVQPAGVAAVPQRAAAPLQECHRVLACSAGVAACESDAGRGLQAPTAEQAHSPTAAHHRCRRTRVLHSRSVHSQVLIIKVYSSLFLIRKRISFFKAILKRFLTIFLWGCTTRVILVDFTVAARKCQTWDLHSTHLRINVKTWVGWSPSVSTNSQWDQLTYTSSDVDILTCFCAGQLDILYLFLADTPLMWSVVQYANFSALASALGLATLLLVRSGGAHFLINTKLLAYLVCWRRGHYWLPRLYWVKHFLCAHILQTLFNTFGIWFNSVRPHGDSE